MQNVQFLHHNSDVKTFSIFQAFPIHNSLTYNYKHSHSLVLMAVADANYKFLLVDTGALGHNSDGGVFKTSKFGNNILNNPNELHIPETNILPEFNEEMSSVFVADEAFPLRPNTMRPYPGRNISSLPPAEDNFNKHLSGARRVVENAYGILASHFRIYRRPILASKETANNIVKTTVCLHNWLLDKNSSEFLGAGPSNIAPAMETERGNNHACFCDFILILYLGIYKT